MGHRVKCFSNIKEDRAEQFHAFKPIINYSCNGGTCWVTWPKPHWWKGQWKGQQCLNKFSNHLPKSSIKSSTLSLQTACTGFYHYLYSSGSSLAGPTLVESSNCKVSYTQQGIVTDIMPATPPEQGLIVVHSTPSRLLSRSTYIWILENCNNISLP